MERRIDDIVELGKLDANILALEAKEDELPRIVAEGEGKVARAAEEFEELRHEFRDTQKDADSLSVDMQAGEEHVRKFRVQLGAVKSNKEYDIFRRQIDKQIEENTRLEDEALIHMEKADEIRSKIKDKEKGMAVAEDALERTRREVEAKLAALDRKKRNLLEERKEQESKIDSEDLARYRRILAAKKNSAVARVEGNFCSACHMTLTSQILNLVLLGQDMVECQGCSRILFWEDKVGSR